ncbi:MAG TPA: TRAM domain-containing protein [Vicinamibacterales bacterium]|nr:TRAM domain-containing protein [Vicinamibacterales bacterium]
MGLNPGAEIELVVDKPASGGRMIARHDGEVVLVTGGIPGERVLARVTRAEKRLAFADTIAVLTRSNDRRDTREDPACGGCLYGHIAYPRQVQLKAQIIEDAFVRIGKIPLAERVIVEFAGDRGYRMRARFHVRGGRAGFFREGTHELCDARQTAQLLAESVDAVDAVVSALAARGIAVESAELSENIAADQRAVHVAAGPSDDLEPTLRDAARAAGLTGATARTPDGTRVSTGEPLVSDPIRLLTGGRATEGTLRRHPESFFQANRFLVSALVGAVMDAVPEGRVLDLYAGVGLFAVALAAAGRGDVTAVEGDPASGRDLERNAAPFGDRLRVGHGSVEGFLLRRRAGAPDTLIVDPPRTGLSPEAGEAIGRSRAGRVIYVSCDAPTMARDARRVLNAGYRMVSLRGFDLFPNTPHVESLGVFELA